MGNQNTFRIFGKVHINLCNSASIDGNFKDNSNQ